MKRALLIMPVILFSFLLVMVVIPGGSSVSAASAANCGQSSDNFLKFPTWYKHLNPHIESGECKIDFTFPNDITKVLLAVIEILLRIAALVAIVFVVMGGVRYTTSQGQPEGTAAARKTILNALLGLVIAVSATAVVSFIGGRFN
jgi:hypothetical protein